MNKEIQELFEEEIGGSTLQNVEKEKLVFSSPQGNHKRSRVGEKWYYFGETEESYSLFHDQIVGENETHFFLHLYEDGVLITDSLVAIEKDYFKKAYPIQPLFPKAMEKDEALDILRNHFKNQAERSTTIR